MEKANRKSIIRRTEKEKLQLIEAWEKSGVSIKRFCEEHHFSDSLFHTWLNKYRRQKQARPQSHFVPVQVGASIPLGEDHPVLFAEVTLRGGHRITLYQLVSADYLRTLTT